MTSVFMAAVSTAVLSTQTSTGQAQSAAKPNVVVIMLDDFDTAALDAAIGGGLAPNIKRYLVDEGYSFSNAFVTSTFGSPTRATFLTGQYPHNHKEIGGDANFGSVPKLNETSTVATWLRNAGYRTGHVGRYLSGYGWFTPATSIPPGWDEWYGLVDPTTWSTEQYVINANRTLVDVGTLAQNAGVELHQIDVLSYLAGAFVQGAPAFDKPFFLAVSPTTFNRERSPGPTLYNVCPDPAASAFGGSYWGVAQKPPVRHRDTVFGNYAFALPSTPDFNEADISDKPLWMQNNPPMGNAEIDCVQKRYWRKLENLRGIDDLVGHLMTTLESTGALSNTMVMFTSDAGDVDGQHRMPEKMAAYEPSIKVPLLVRMPGTPSPRTISRLVLNTDLAPTIAEAAGVTPTLTVDGRSLLPLLRDPDGPWRKVGLIEHVYAAWTPSLGYPPNYLAIRTDAPVTRTFVRYPTVTAGPKGELYDLDEDPFQLDNLFADPSRQGEVQRLDIFLYYLMSCKGATCALMENASFLN